ncbi:MAG: hypothetical protein WBB73_01695 [Candidatus Aminicenantaceae bacterium]
MKKTLLGLLLISLTLSLASAQVVDENGQLQVPLVIKITTYLDGSQSITYLPLDPETGKVLPPDPFLARVADASAVKLQTAVVTRSLHWDTPVNIVFDVTKDSKPHTTKINKIQNKYSDKRRGNKSTPTMSVVTQEVQVKPISVFPNPWDFYRQLNRDGHNTVVMTQDDQFFKDPNGVIFDPEIVSNTLLYATAAIVQKGNRYVGTFWIHEVDVYFVYNFFGLNKNTYFRIGTVAFRFGFGYQANVWSHDYFSADPFHVTTAAFKKTSSTTWQEISFPRDDLFYMDKLGDTWTPNYLATPRLLPFEEEVINVGDYELPWLDEFDEIHLEKSTILFVTNLKGFAGNKKLAVKFFRVTDDTPPKDVKITGISGNTLRYPLPHPQVGQWYPSIFLNHIRLGRELHLNKLKNTVNQFGTMRTIDGITFEKAVKIKVTITGYLTESGSKKTITRIYWLVNALRQN